MQSRKPNRRNFLALSAGAAALTACNKEAPSEIGAPLRSYGERAPAEKAVRTFPESSKTPGTGSARTPLQDLHGTITPASLHFERLHSGVPDIDRAKHQILVHGLVEQPLVFTMDDLLRFPSVSRICFLECSGNSGGEWNIAQKDPQQADGLLSCSEWTGVPLKLLLNQARLKPEAKWVIAEGADACLMARSLPLEKALDDALVAYAQNGEALRPEQGYPVRLLAPGWEGNINVKWLHRLHVVDQPSYTRDETSHYTDLLPSGKAEIFTFVMEAKSIITRPAGGQTLAFGPGPYEISGLAWSGRGKIQRVEISADSGRTWADAELQEPVLSKALTRFRLPWKWDGQATSLQSRCTDETGYLQPTHDELVAARGTHSQFHYNGIKVWYVHQDGSVSHEA